MKVHKGEGYERTHIYVRGEKWKKFKDLCKDHNTTTCHLLDALLDAALKSEEKGFIDIAGANPLIINISHVFLGKPRSPWKVDVSELAVDKNVCHVCGGHVIRERLVEPTGFIEGSCFSCGSEWLIKKGS